MSAPAFRYQVGGSLPLEFPGYVERGADQELVAHLLRGETCSVFNSRQMGKSSLKVRAMQRLQAAGCRCAVIDPQGRGTTVTEEQWYAGTVKRLIEDFDLEERLPYRQWSEAADPSLSPVERFFEFIDRHLLPATGDAPLVIFVEEVDSLLSLKFDTDGFFSLIRSLHERRADQPIYRRLCFAFLGVATPYDLIRGEGRSAFSIDHAVELSGFTVAEAWPLLAGLKGRVAEPEAALAAVLHWSGGQPFLTQKLLALLLDHPQGETNTEAWVAEVVRRQVLSDWEANDTPPHLRTIRDRLVLSEERGRGRLLGLAGELLERGSLPLEPSREEHQLLRLSGLVSLRQGRLVLANPIVEALFNQAWLERQQADLRPPIYREALQAWQAAELERRGEHLIAGAPLREALAWARTRRLADADQAFLEASREADENAQRAEQAARLAEERAAWAEQASRLAQERATRAEQEARNRRRLALALAAGLAGLITLVAVNMKLQQENKSSERKTRDLEERTKALMRPLRFSAKGDRFAAGSHHLNPQALRFLEDSLAYITRTLCSHRFDMVEVIGYTKENFSQGVGNYDKMIQRDEGLNLDRLRPGSSVDLSLLRAMSVASVLEQSLGKRFPFLTFRAYAAGPYMSITRTRNENQASQFPHLNDSIDLRLTRSTFSDSAARYSPNDWTQCKLSKQQISIPLRHSSVPGNESHERMPQPTSAPLRIPPKLRNDFQDEEIPIAVPYRSEPLW
ncbi:MAG: AAA-like domain-containing protein [Cyanobium sp.]